MVVSGVDATPNGEQDFAHAFLTYIVLGLIFGLVNAVIKPVVRVLAVPFYILTLGLFTLVVNALMLVLTARIGELAGLTLHIDGFWQAILGALVVSLVSMVASVFVPDPGDAR